VTLHGDQPVPKVIDFGIAKATQQPLTDKTVFTQFQQFLGTPAYMSPEQATGESPVDERTDIYALGCVLYEMLAGEPPFAGRSVEAVMIHRLSAPAPRVSVVRDDISPEIDAAITKSLAHAPAVRFAKAEDFAAILKQGVVATTVAAPAQAAATLVQQGHARSWKRVSVALLALSLLLSGLWALSRGRSMPGRAAPESDAIVVLPFRMLGPDSLLAGLDEGMVDLLATRLSAGANARIIDPRTALAAWRRRVLRDADYLTQQSVLDIAEDLGAGRVITGSIVGAVGEITLVASLLSVPEGTVRSRASLTGRADSLMVLVDRLTAQLISVDAGEAEHRLAALTSTSLPALRAYLEGQAAYRRFLFDRARERFANAVQLDSTFALAALGLRVSLWWGHTRFPPELIERAERLAWTFRNRLNARDELRVRAHLGARYPEWTPPAEQIAFLESVIAIVPDDPELWQVFGYLLFHGGAHLSIPAWRERSSAALRRAIELDSLFLAPRNHLVRLAVEARDTASLRELSTFYSTHAPLEAAEMIAWLASAVGGASMGGQLPALQLGTFREQSLRRVVIESPSFGLRLGDAESALALLYERSASASERERTLLLAREFALNRGRPAEALRAIRELRGASRATAFRHERLREIVYYALYWDGDQAAGAQAAAESSRVAGLAAPTGTTAFAEQMRARCVLEQWRLSRNDRRTAWQSIGLVHTAAEALPARREAARMQACAALLQALLSSAEKRPDVLRVLDRLDSLHMAGLPDLRNEDVWFCAGNLVAARLRAAHGDLEGALAAIRRRGEPGDQKILLSSYLREEGRLALLAGDTTAAIRAYQHFLALRSHPEPQLVDDAARVRSEVHRLIARSGDN
jgi:serine/threonine-protein kinase